MTLPVSGRVLLVATVRAETESGSDQMFGLCRLEVNGNVYNSTGTQFEAHDPGDSFVSDNGSLVTVTDVLPAGSNTFKVRCNQVDLGAIRYPDVRVVAVALSAN